MPLCNPPDNRKGVVVIVEKDESGEELESFMQLEWSLLKKSTFYHVLPFKFYYYCWLKLYYFSFLVGEQGHEYYYIFYFSMIYMANLI